MKKKGLGRGLEALIPEGDLTEQFRSTDQIVALGIDEVYPNRNQPRKDFDEEKMRHLQESIEQNGLIQPIIVSKEKTGYQIIAGERRWRASKAAKLREIPSIIRSYDELMKAKVSIIENVQRDDFNPVEEAMAYKILIENYSLTQKELSESIGKSRSYIANMIRILNLEPEIIEKISNNSLSFGHAKALLMFSEELRLKFAKKAVKEQLSVRKLEQLSQQQDKKPKELQPADPEVLKMEQILSDILGTKVNISYGKNRGHIEIDYYSNEDLERIINLVKNQKLL
jgi:ParB family chromosome partitioning protein